MAHHLVTQVSEYDGHPQTHYQQQLQLRTHTTGNNTPSSSNNGTTTTLNRPLINGTPIPLHSSPRHAAGCWRIFMSYLWPFSLYSSSSSSSSDNNNASQAPSHTHHHASFFQAASALIPRPPHSTPLTKPLLPPLPQHQQYPHSHHSSLATPPKKTLVLDLDETLVHSSFKPISDADFILDIELEGVTHRVYVRKRPGVDYFLARVAQHFELVLFTASLSKYADPLIDILDPAGLITSRFFRQHCVFYYGNYVKDLTHLGRNMSSIVILDNSPLSYLFQPTHAIPCTSWFSDRKDRELWEILEFLEEYVVPLKTWCVPGGSMNTPGGSRSRRTSDEEEALDEILDTPNTPSSSSSFNIYSPTLECVTDGITRGKLDGKYRFFHGGGGCALTQEGIRSGGGAANGSNGTNGYSLMGLSQQMNGLTVLTSPSPPTTHPSSTTPTSLITKLNAPITPRTSSNNGGGSSGAVHSISTSAANSSPAHSRNPSTSSSTNSATSSWQQLKPLHTHHTRTPSEEKESISSLLASESILLKGSASLSSLNKSNGGWSTSSGNSSPSRQQRGGGGGGGGGDR